MFGCIQLPSLQRKTLRRLMKIFLWRFISLSLNREKSSNLKYESSRRGNGGATLVDGCTKYKFTNVKEDGRMTDAVAILEVYCTVIDNCISAT